MTVPQLPAQTDVLVVGAGPVGLATAVALAGEGIGVTVLDRQREGDNTSRAAVVHARTLEVLETIGVAGTLAERGVTAPTFSIRDRDRTLVDVSFADLPTRYPYALMVPQWVTEEVLLARLRALGGDVVRPVAVTGLAQHADGVEVTLDDGRAVRAGWVVGADGMHSTVRDLAGIGFAGEDDPEDFALADVRIDGDLPMGEVVLYLSGSGTLVWAPLPGGTGRLVAAVERPPAHPDAAYVQALLDARGPARAPVRVAEVVWGSRFRIHHRIATTFRAGRVLLAGDAGHVHSPAGGQGMNLGLRDAIALGRALAEVVRGGPQAILDEYSAARMPAARRVSSLARRLTRLATVPPALRPVRNVTLRLVSRVPAVRRAFAWRLAGLDDGPARRRPRRPASAISGPRRRSTPARLAR